MDSLLLDVRHAVRQLARTPGFALVTVLTLALGIGANTAIFSVVNSVILRPLGYPKADLGMFVTSRFPNLGFDKFWVSPPEYFELQEWNQSFASLGAYTTGEVNLAAAGRPRRARSARVDRALLDALGVQPEQGRLLTAEETRAGGPEVVMLSDELWRSEYAGRDIIGQTIDVNGVRAEVVGIMPPGFDVLDNRVELWRPLQLDPANREGRGNHGLYLVGRLKDGLTRSQAEAEITTLYARWESLYPRTHHPTADRHQLQMWPVQDEVVGSARLAIWVLQAAVGFVLLIACVNLANLLLARAETRHREFAVRAALGAGRWRLLRQFLAEGVMLSLAGGAAGLGVAVFGLRGMLAAFPDSLPRAADVSLDPAVLVFALAVSLLTGAIFGLAPLMHASPGALAQSLKEGGGRGATGAGRHVVRRALVVAEVALAVMLVVGAGLMLRTVVNLMQVDAGFDRAPLTTFALDLPSGDYADGPSVARFYQSLVDRLAAAPGVASVSAMSGLPPDRQVNANDTDIEGYEKQTEDDPIENIDYYQFATAGYFETMGIPLVDGRAFERADVTRGPVVVVNEALERRFFKGQSAVGHRLTPDPRIGWFTIVGVAKDVKQGGVDQETGTEVYFMFEQAAAAGFPMGNMNVVIRSALPPASLRGIVDEAVRAADPTLPVIRFRAMDEVFAESVSRPRLLANLLGVFAGLALLLAAIGTYGVLSYMVTERRREIGIRMALGAARGSVLQMVMGQGMAITAVGLVAGIAGAVALNRLLASLLFGVAPGDPVTLAGVAATIVVVALVACFIPARRATRVDPMLVLREE
ncbi:MAG: ABC transporter permease [Vicinamibacterales bacterium]